MSNAHLLTDSRIQEIIENEWLGLGDTSQIEIANPFHARTAADIENPVEHVLNLMRRPDYFSFTVKHIFNKTTPPMQLAILRELWNRPFPMLIGSRGMGKSFLLALYAMLRATLDQGSKIVIVGAAFRQAKVIFEYCEEIWGNAPILRDICGGSNKNGPRRDVDRCTMRIGESLIIALPLGDGSKIRGQRANIIIADEFACLEKNTLVETDRGLVRIGDCEQDLGTFGLIQPDGQVVRPDAFVRTPPCYAYRVTTESGYEFVCSGIHQVMTTRGWKLAKNLSNRDYLVHKSSPFFPANCVADGDLLVDEDIGWLLGALLAGRSVDGIDDAFRGSLERLGLGSGDGIPWSILQSPRKVVVAFLSGLFSDSGKSYYAASEQLAREVQHVLHKLGIRCSRRKRMLRANGVCRSPERLRVRRVKQLDGQQTLYDFHVPDTHCFLAASFIQHNSIPNEIFENVVSGFAAVSMDPVDKLKQAAKKRAMHRLGLLSESKDESLALPGLRSNQTILSGTAYYGFNHFCDYWKRHKAFVESRGDRRKLEELFGGEVPPKFDWRDYCVMRIPVELLPEGFMDEKHVAKAKATIHNSQFQMEYGACFALDSNGFFKRSLIEQCVVGKPDKPIHHESCGEVVFNAVLRGSPHNRYVMAIDPASEHDNFSIVILELWPDHRRIVHCWTTTRKRHKDKLKKGLAKEQDFYSYVARRIRDLINIFPCERIALDSQGGGVAVMEALADPERLRESELPILPVIDEEKPKDTDNVPGNHILEMINFAKAEWVSEANHGLRKDFEDKVLLFPEFDPAVLGLAIEEDKIRGRVKVTADGEEKLYDTLEDCVMEVEELKDELATIVQSQTGPTLRDRWDTPEVKQGGGKKGRLRKDRYSALLMANMSARCLARVTSRPEYVYLGGFAHDLAKQKEGKPGKARPRWQNPDWYTAGHGYGAVVQRDR